MPPVSFQDAQGCREPSESSHQRRDLIWHINASSTVGLRIDGGVDWRIKGSTTLVRKLESLSITVEVMRYCQILGIYLRGLQQGLKKIVEIRSVKKMQSVRTPTFFVWEHGGIQFQAVGMGEIIKTRFGYKILS